MLGYTSDALQMERQYTPAAKPGTAGHHYSTTPPPHGHPTAGKHPPPAHPLPHWLALSLISLAFFPTHPTLPPHTRALFPPPLAHDHPPLPLPNSRPATPPLLPVLPFHLSSPGKLCMGDPDIDHGFIFDDQGRVDILCSPFFDVTFGNDRTADEYVDRIIYQLALVIEDQIPPGRWYIVNTPPTSPDSTTSPAAIALRVTCLLVASLGFLRSSSANPTTKSREHMEKQVVKSKKSEVFKQSYVGAKIAVALANLRQRNMVKGKEKSNVSLRRDPSWKYSVQVDVGGEKTYVYLKCNFCGKVVKGGVTRMKEHLSCSHKNVAPCASVPDNVKDEIAAYMKKSTTTKHLQQEQFDERVEQGAYYGSESGKGSSSTINNRGVRGPMDQYMVNPGEDRGQTQMMPAADRRLRNKGLKDDEDPLVCEDVASDNEWFIDDETDLPLSDLQLEDLSVDVLRGEADQGGVSTSATPHTSTSSAAKGKRKMGIIEDDEDLNFIDTIGEEDSLEDPFSDGT
ncbi:hypothetical protein M5K25_018072 [Dendrobium thyrsiflorum]|uniref:BED-type domain-containing protein n=1 Tax=Dendrobium thyrsiflorum TaxID=117978 RepID=A0ABD0UHQ4_DENTH